MKVVVTTGIFPPDIGGPASYVPRLASALSKRGDTVEVVTLAGARAIAEPQAAPFTVHRVARNLPRIVRMARTIALIAARARRADVILANGLHLEAAIAALLSGRPAVAKVVGDTVWEQARHAGRRETLDAFQQARLPLRWRVLRALQDAYIRGFDRVLTPSRYLAAIVRGWGVPGDRIDVVYNAVPLPPAAEETGAEFDIVAVGRLVPWKHFAELIALAGRNDWSLRIVGDGPLRSELEAAAMAYGAAVAFTGHLPQDEVPRALRSGRVFVLNSSYEGLPHIVLEAMAAGVPVVATSAGGTPETIEDGRTGRLVPIGDEASLEAALRELLADEALRERFAGQASRVLYERFSFERMIEGTRIVLQRIARQGRGGHAKAA